MVVEFLIKPHRALASNASSVLLNNRGEGMGEISGVTRLC